MPKTPKKSKKLKISHIRTDCGTQVREQVDEKVVKWYASLMDDGAEFPPLDVFYDGTDYRLAAGHHRLGAWELRGEKEVPVTIHDGTSEDAILFAVGSNSRHGVPMRVAERRSAIATLLKLEAGRAMTDRAIAVHIGCSGKTVASVRRELEARAEIPHQEERIGVDGKTYPAGSATQSGPVDKSTNTGVTEAEQTVDSIKACPSDAPTDPADDCEPIQLEEDASVDVVDPDGDPEGREPVGASAPACFSDGAEAPNCPSGTDPMEVPVAHARLDNLEASVRELDARWPQEMSRTMLVKRIEKCLEIAKG